MPLWKDGTNMTYKTRILDFGIAPIHHTGSDEAYNRMVKHLKNCTPKASKAEKLKMRPVGPNMENTKELLSDAYNLYLENRAKRGKHADLIRLYVTRFGITRFRARTLHGAMLDEYNLK